MKRKKCQKRLAVLWFIGAGFLFALFFFQTILGRYGNVSEAWGWLLPTIVPTLSMMVGVLVMDTIRSSSDPSESVDPFVFKLSYALSAGYLVVVALTILMQPFAVLSPLQLLKQSNLWLGPFQGLVTASLGAFFVNREATE